MQDRLQEFEGRLKKIPTSKKNRLVNFLIDLVFVYATKTLIQVVHDSIILFSGGFLKVYRIDLPTILLYFLLPYTLYYILFEGLWGQSIGKMITRTKVVDKQGNKPGLGAVVIRAVCRLIPFEPFSFFGKSKRGWHDTLSDTYVVKID
jgi:uncharacterized RDD family membrane protein YckC